MCVGTDDSLILVVTVPTIDTTLVEIWIHFWEFRVCPSLNCVAMLHALACFSWSWSWTILRNIVFYNWQAKVDYPQRQHNIFRIHMSMLYRQIKPSLTIFCWSLNWPRRWTNIDLYIGLQLHIYVESNEKRENYITLWHHQMETFSASLAICAGNSLVTGEFPSQRPETLSFDIFFDL